MLLVKVAELAERFGLRPSEAEADLLFVNEDKDPDGVGYYGLSIASVPTDPDKADQCRKMKQLLGIQPQQGPLKSQFLDGLEDAVDRALALAPRARTR